MRLIDADRALERLSEDKREAFTKHEVWLMFSNHSSSSIDLVRCKECKKHGKNSCPMTFTYAVITDDNNYCTYAEKRENDDNI